MLRNGIESLFCSSDYFWASWALSNMIDSFCLLAVPYEALPAQSIWIIFTLLSSSFGAFAEDSISLSEREKVLSELLSWSLNSSYSNMVCVFYLDWCKIVVYLIFGTIELLRHCPKLTSDIELSKAIMEELNVESAFMVLLKGWLKMEKRGMVV